LTWPWRGSGEQLLAHLEYRELAGLQPAAILCDSEGIHAVAGGGFCHRC